MAEKYVTATEVASYVYCPESWRLGKALNLRASNEPEMADGTIRHEKWQEEEQISTGVIKLAFAILVVAVLLYLIVRL